MRSVFARRALASLHISAVSFSSVKREHLWVCRSLSNQLPLRASSPHLNFAPLCDRPVTHKSTAEEFWTWRRWAQGMAMAVGDKYRVSDGGPDSRDLLRELEWMIDDAVSHVAIPVAHSSFLKVMLDAFPFSVDQLDSTDPLSEVETATYLNAKHMVSNVSRNPQSDSFRVLKWQDIKSFELEDRQCLVCHRASLEELSLLWTERVQHRRPFQYVVGCAHWRDYVLYVKEGVLIPRPETEQMIDLAEEAIKLQPNLSKGVWADLGTGSGALAIGLAYLLDPQGSVLAVDISNEAISIACINIQKYGLQNMVTVLKGSWFSALEQQRGKLAGVLSNPPYIPSCHMSTLQAEVGQYEPRNALDGGQEGVSDLTTICCGAAWALRSDGCMILETNGGGQAEIIAGLLESMPGAPFRNIQLIKDFAGIVRFVRATHV